MLPNPTIHPLVYEGKTVCLPAITEMRKSPTQRVFRPEELHKNESAFKINGFEDVNDSLLKYLGPECKCPSHEDHGVFYKTVNDELSIPQITSGLILISTLSFKDSPIPSQNGCEKGQLVS